MNDEVVNQNELRRNTHVNSKISSRGVAGAGEEMARVRVRAKEDDKLVGC
jgi:ribosomal protein L31E